MQPALFKDEASYMKKVSFKARWGRLCRFLTMSELKGNELNRQSEAAAGLEAKFEIFKGGFTHS